MSSGGFHNLLKEDSEYQKAKETESLAERKCEFLNLTEVERKLVNW